MQTLFFSKIKFLFKDLNLNNKYYFFLDKALLIIMLKWQAYGRCKTRLSRDIGKINALSIQKKMTDHTVSVAKNLEEKGLIEINLAISGVGFKKGKRWASELGIKNFNLQGRGCLGEKMKRQLLYNEKFCVSNKIRKVIIIGTDLPDLCHLDIENTLKKLQKNDLVLGPSNDGGYWLIAFSKKLLEKNFYLPFINIKWSNSDVLKNTIENISSTSYKYALLQTKIDVDTIEDITIINNKVA